jgi:hypothetical protein
VRRVQRAQPDVVARFSSGRFEPYRCEGTWKGRRPPCDDPRAGASGRRRARRSRALSARRARHRSPRP